MKTFSCFITFLFVNICICFGQKSKDEVIFNILNHLKNIHLNIL